MFYYIVVFDVAAMGMWIIIALMWSILGAVLNPEVMLPKATATVTFVSVIMMKIKSTKQIISELLREITDMVSSKMEFMLTQSLDRVIGQIQGTLPGDANSVGNALASGRYMNALA